jgi:hypothetical protein
MTVRRPIAFPLAATLGVTAALFAACGQDDSGLLSSGGAERMVSSLDRIERAVESGECDRAQQALADLKNRIDNLPSSTDPELRARLREGEDRLSSQVPEDCERNRPETTTTETEPVPTETVPTETTPTETTPTETTPTETTPTETTPTEPAPTETVPGGTPGPEEGAFVPDEDDEGDWSSRRGGWRDDD